MDLCLGDPEGVGEFAYAGEVVTNTAATPIEIRDVRLVDAHSVDLLGVVLMPIVDNYRIPTTRGWPSPELAKGTHKTMSLPASLAAGQGMNVILHLKTRPAGTGGVVEVSYRDGGADRVARGSTKIYFPSTCDPFPWESIAATSGASDAATGLAVDGSPG